MSACSLCKEMSLRFFLPRHRKVNLLCSRLWEAYRRADFTSRVCEVGPCPCRQVEGPAHVCTCIHPGPEPSDCSLAVLHRGALLSKSIIYIPVSKRSVHCGHAGGLHLYVTSLGFGPSLSIYLGSISHMLATVLLARNTAVDTVEDTGCLAFWAHTGASQNVLLCSLFTF